MRDEEEKEIAQNTGTVIKTRYLRERSFWLASVHSCMAKRKQTGRRKW